jgi:hypothetical protein
MIEQYLKSLLKVVGIGAAFATLPLFASMADLQPPWPPSIGPVSAALTLAASLIVWEWTRKSAVRNRRRWVLFGISLAVVGLLGYLTLYSIFIENMPQGGRVVRGYECTRRALEIYHDDCPDLPREALQDSEWEALVLWTRTSVTIARISLAVSWLLWVGGLIACLGAIVAGRKFSGSAAKRA